MFPWMKEGTRPHSQGNVQTFILSISMSVYWPQLQSSIERLCKLKLAVNFCLNFLCTLCSFSLWLQVTRRRRGRESRIVVTMTQWKTKLPLTNQQHLPQPHPPHPQTPLLVNRQWQRTTHRALTSVPVITVPQWPPEIRAWQQTLCQTFLVSLSIKSWLRSAVLPPSTALRNTDLQKGGAGHPRCLQPQKSYLTSPGHTQPLPLPWF